MTKHSKRPTRNPFKKPPKGYKRTPNDNIEDYHVVVERAKIPGIRKRGVKVDGWEVNVSFQPDGRKVRRQPKTRRFGGKHYVLADHEPMETMIKGSAHFDPGHYNNYLQNMHESGWRVRILGRHIYLRKMSPREFAKQRERDQARRERKQQEHDAE